MHRSMQNITQCHYLENFTLTFVYAGEHTCHTFVHNYSFLTFVKNQLIYLFIYHLQSSARIMISYYQRAGNLIN